jgi:hypothetical protein
MRKMILVPCTCGFSSMNLLMVAFMFSGRMVQAVMYFMLTPGPCRCGLAPADCTGPRAAPAAGQSMTGWLAR